MKDSEDLSGEDFQESVMSKVKIDKEKEKIKPEIKAEESSDVQIVNVTTSKRRRELISPKEDKQKTTNFDLRKRDVKGKEKKTKPGPIQTKLTASIVKTTSAKKEEKELPIVEQKSETKPEPKKVEKEKIIKEFKPIVGEKRTFTESTE